MDWQHSYEHGDTPWDLRGATPPLEALLASGRLADFGLQAAAAVAVPGCGRGHDLRVWARAGYRSTGFDIAPNVVAEARALLAWNRIEGAEVHCRDLLGIGHEFAAGFDAVYDYTCFCALPVHLRGAYAREMAAILADGGLWLGLVFPMRQVRPPRAEGASGPPFVMRREDLDAAFGSQFEFVADFDAVGSVPLRAGAERWFVWRRRPRA